MATLEEQHPECRHQDQQPVPEHRTDSGGRAARCRDHRDQGGGLPKLRRPGHTDENLRDKHGRESRERLPEVESRLLERGQRLADLRIVGALGPSA
jgi:hypothetical protein